MLYPSLETVSEVSAASHAPPMMTRLSWLTLQMLDPTLPSVKLRGSVTQPPCLHCKQLLPVDEYAPPHRVWPDWTWLTLSSGSAGSLHVVFCHGMNISADCREPSPPVIMMASEIENVFYITYFP